MYFKCFEWFKGFIQLINLNDKKFYFFNQEELQIICSNHQNKHKYRIWPWIELNHIGMLTTNYLPKRFRRDIKDQILWHFK